MKAFSEAKDKTIINKINIKEDCSKWNWTKQDYKVESKYTC